MVGSFKIRGVVHKLHTLAAAAVPGKSRAAVVTMSAGNFGRSFSFAASSVGLAATVIMPETAPLDRVGA